MRTIFGITFGTRNVAAGEFSYAQRIALGRVFRDEQRSEYRRVVDAYKVLYGYSPKWLPFRLRYKRLQNLLEEFAKLVEVENKLLDYKPSEAERAAGIDKLGKELGDMSTVKALAKTYKQSPDDILRWEYSAVLQILHTDLREYQYQQRLSKELEKQAKNKQNSGRYVGRHSR